MSKNEIDTTGCEFYNNDDTPDKGFCHLSWQHNDCYFAEKCSDSSTATTSKK